MKLRILIALLFVITLYSPLQVSFTKALDCSVPAPDDVDSDGDGICDADDLCPTEFGSIAKGGCPNRPTRGGTSDPVTPVATGPQATEPSPTPMPSATARPNYPVLDNTQLCVAALNNDGTLLNVRAAPSTTADIIGKLAISDIVNVVGATDLNEEGRPGWLQIEGSFGIGWVSAQYMRWDGIDCDAIIANGLGLVGELISYLESEGCGEFDENDSFLLSLPDYTVANLLATNAEGLCDAFEAVQAIAAGFLPDRTQNETLVAANRLSCNDSLPSLLVNVDRLQRANQTLPSNLSSAGDCQQLFTETVSEPPNEEEVVACVSPDLTPERIEEIRQTYFAMYGQELSPENLCDFLKILNLIGELSPSSSALLDSLEACTENDFDPLEIVLGLIADGYNIEEILAAENLADLLCPLDYTALAPYKHDILESLPPGLEAFAACPPSVVAIYLNERRLPPEQEQNFFLEDDVCLALTEYVYLGIIPDGQHGGSGGTATATPTEETATEEAATTEPDNDPTPTESASEESPTTLPSLAEIVLLSDGLVRTTPLGVFSKLSANGSFDIFIINPDASGLQQLTNTADVNENYPSYNEKTGRVAYWSETNGQVQLIVDSIIPGRPRIEVAIDESYERMPGPLAWLHGGTYLIVALQPRGNINSTYPNLYLISMASGSPKIDAGQDTFIDNANQPVVFSFTENAGSPMVMYTALDLKRVIITDVQGDRGAEYGISGETYACQNPAVSPKSIWIYFTCTEGDRTVIYQMLTTTNTPIALDFGGQYSNISSIAPGPVDGYIAFEENNRIYLGRIQENRVFDIIWIQSPSAGEARNLEWRK